MTVTYTAQVATCRGFGCFLKLLFRWRGSIYKLVWLDLICFLLIYYVLNIVYRIGLDQHQKIIFEGIVKYCETYSNLIPLSFVLGFYVSIVMTRWWNQYTSIPWPDSLAVFVSANIHGQDERGRLMRRTVMRYVCLCLTMVLTNVSPRVKKRFPSLQHLVEAGLLVENEKYVMEAFNAKFNRHSKHWMPIVWASSIITRARKEGRIRDDFAVKTLIDELNKFRGQAGLLISYDTISVPLVYTQVVTLAVYTFFLTSVMGQQWVENKKIEEKFVNMIDLYFPIFTTLQFFFYMGWLKVAESLINPFGEDDDDFEVNWIIDRNLQVSYMIVDEMHHEHPELIKDQYWDEILPPELPYTKETAGFREEHPQPSTANIEVQKNRFSNMNGTRSSGKFDEMVGKSVQSVNYKFPENDIEADDNASGIHFTAGRQGSVSSMSTMASSLTRVNTVASALKRFLSREDGQKGSCSTPDSGQQPRMSSTSPSTASLSQFKFPAGGSMKITDQVIEEVDEQMTIQSMRQPEPRPTAQSLFAPGRPTPSQPVDVPTTTRSGYNRTQSVVANAEGPFGHSSNDNDDFVSASAPGRCDNETETVETPAGLYGINIDDFDRNEPQQTVTAKSENGDSSINQEDEFEKLRQAREKERQDRIKMKFARSISNQPGCTLDTDVVLDQLGSRSDVSNRSFIFDPNV